MKKPTPPTSTTATLEPVVSRARARILETAAELFYQEGVRAVGVDLVVERSGVAKTSLYRHFATKDDLVVAFLEQEDAAYWRDWEAVAAGAKGDAGAELQAHMRGIARHVAAPKYRGCPFLNVATEFPAAAHPARAVATRNKTELHRRLSGLAKKLGVRKPDALADQLVLLFDGAYMHGQLRGKRRPGQALEAAGMALVQAAERR